jgi:hypothetical protein
MQPWDSVPVGCDSSPRTGTKGQFLTSKIKLDAQQDSVLRGESGVRRSVRFRSSSVQPARDSRTRTRCRLMPSSW